MARELRRIMVVEDDQDIRELVSMSLEALGGYEVDLCSSGAEALERAPACQPDLILLDFMMPGMDGGEVIGRLRADPSIAEIPVAFMTAKANADEIRRFLALGAAAVITKPFDPVDLPDRVRSIWEAAGRDG